jgi:hypothetical protein
MLNTKKIVAGTNSAKAELLAAKMLRSTNAHAVALAECDSAKIRGTERVGIVAFATTAMQAGSPRGAIAKAALAPGKTTVFTFAQIAKAAKVKVSEVSRANLEYIAHNISHRNKALGGLVGMSFEYDLEAETVTVRPYRVPAKVERKPSKVLALAAPIGDAE